MEKLESVIVNTVFREDEPKKQFISGDIAKKYLVKYSKIIKELSSYYVENKKDKIISFLLKAVKSNAADVLCYVSKQVVPRRTARSFGYMRPAGCCVPAQRGSGWPPAQS